MARSAKLDNIRAAVVERPDLFVAHAQPPRRVTVVRGWGDHRRLDVTAGELSGFHVTTVAGGTSAALPRALLSLRMWTARLYRRALSDTPASTAHRRIRSRC